MIVFAVDPGTVKSGFAVYDDRDGGSVVDHGEAENHELLYDVIRRRSLQNADRIAIEMVASYGMPVGRETFETCVWIGRFLEGWGPPECELVYRRNVKMHLCRSMKAKDSNIWQALVDRFGAPGTKKAPGKLYGVRSHARQALALAVFVADRDG